MSVAARNILHRLTDLGAKIERQGDKLLLEAGTAPVPGEILATIREHKAEVLEELSSKEGRRGLKEKSPATDQFVNPAGSKPRVLLDAADLRDRYEERAAICQYEGHQERTQAEAIAWCEVAAIWYRQHGERMPSHLCAGCGQAITDDSNVLLLPHGERTHTGEESYCRVRYENRWKRQAAIALALIGIPTPTEIAAENEEAACRHRGDHEGARRVR